MKAIGLVILSYGIIIFIMWLFGDLLTRLQSLLIVSSAAIIGLVFLSVFHVGNIFGKKVIYILCLAFIIKVIVGVWHYLYFIDSDYFIDNTSFSYRWDYEWMDEMMRFVSNYWRQNGLSPLPASYYIGNKNPFLIAYNGILYFLSGDHPLNIAPWNVLHSLYIAILVGALALQSGATQSQSRIALTLAAFQPFGFISSIMWRDSVGQFWLILGAYLLIITRDKKYLWVFLLPVAWFFGWIYRQPYLLIILLLAGYMFVAGYKSKLKGGLIAIAIGFVLVFYNILPILMNLALDRFEEGKQLSFNLLLFPLRIFRAFAGPFPWYQVFMGVDGAIYMPMEFLQAVFNLALVVYAIPIAWNMWKKTNKLDPGLLLCALLFIAGAQAIGVHMPYISVGMVLLLPLVCRVAPTKLFEAFIFCFCGFIAANVLYWMFGFTGSGFIMDITGY